MAISDLFHGKGITIFSIVGKKTSFIKLFIGAGGGEDYQRFSILKHDENSTRFNCKRLRR